jgi:ceramide glucosyltransferase
MLVRDIMMPAIWLRGWLGGTVDWRGNRMMIGTDSSQLEQLPAT